MSLSIQKLSMSPAYRVLSSDLRRQIVSGAMATGEVLPTETELSQRYGVNRSTVRESLRQLEQEGLLLREGKRLRVSIPRSQDLASTAEQALRMQQVSLRDVWQVACVLEPLCARLAAGAASASDLQALERNLLLTRQVVEAGGSPVEVDMEFQNLVAQASHNPVLVMARGPVVQLMRAGYAAIAPALPQSGARLLEVHGQVLGALQQRDAESAERLMQRHMEDYRRGCAAAGLDMDQPVVQAD